MEHAVLIDRLWHQTEVTEEGCCEWQGGTFASGYGRIRFEGKLWRLHRLAYTIFRGEIPKGLELDHTCRNKRCWNPDHLEAVTHAENMRRARGTFSTLREVCFRGHPFTPENTYIRRNGARWCRICARERDRRRRQREPTV